MKNFNKIKNSIVDILDVEEEEINPETFLIRELEAESIDLLELAVAVNNTFNIDVKDDDIFLRSLRLYLTEAEENKTDTLEYLDSKFPFLTKDRINEIMSELNSGPVLKVKDIVSYVDWNLC